MKVAASIREAAFFYLPLYKRTAVRLFIGATFISAELTDISFEEKVVLCFYFYALGDVFRRNGMVQQNCIVNNHFELERSIPKNKNTLHVFPMLRNLP